MIPSLIPADYPDPDIIRVGSVYYLISTTMHFFPGGEILKSPDLLRWEHCSWVFDALGGPPQRSLLNGDIYGRGMWAACLRYHAGTFHVVFSCNETKETLHYTARSIEGPWTKQVMKGFYYDSSLLFDDDGRVYIVHGNREVRLTELLPDLSGPRPGGLDRLILKDASDGLGYEGHHFYKLFGRYWLFSIHWPAGHLRTQACFSASSPGRPFSGGDILEDDLGLPGKGAAQGGVVDTPDGRWFAFLFQDHGAAGRMPVLLPLSWEKDGPVIHTDRDPGSGAADSLRQLAFSDTLRNRMPLPGWQWNHQPDLSLVSAGEEGLCITSGRIPEDLEHTPNMLTQRVFGSRPSCRVTVDGSRLLAGDRAGLMALQGCFAALCLERMETGFRMVRVERAADREHGGITRSDEPVREETLADLSSPSVILSLSFDFTDLKDTVRLSWTDEAGTHVSAPDHQLVYRLDHFTGVRMALFMQAGKTAGGTAVFRDFEYILPE